MKRYFEIKKELGDVMVLFRVGDTYETYDEDARKLSELIGVPVTERDGIATAGFPADGEIIVTVIKKMVHSARVAIIDFE